MTLEIALIGGLQVPVVHAGERGRAQGIITLRITAVAGATDVGVVILAPGSIAVQRAERLCGWQLSCDEHCEPRDIGLGKIGDTQRHTFARVVIRMSAADAADEVAQLSRNVLGGKLGERRCAEASIPFTCRAMTGSALSLPYRRAGRAGQRQGHGWREICRGRVV